MLELKQITKDYPAGGETVRALKGISLAFRESEFVSILGPSGCGKTTMLNLIGGLDQYTSGDLIINGKSTRDFRDRDWDAYRNHSVGFVFQSYNLIPHQTVLRNVELALTLSGVSKKERRERAREALERVGLGDQLQKRPSEMSGGQMQRVAIARAIVNDPDIVLADEPTGALDTETSLSVMEILKEISNDRLVIMVTHNPELAEKYSTRIVRMLDGRITDDSAPLSEAEIEAERSADAKKQSAAGKKKKPSMSFATSFGLSLHNLFTKKGRTALTGFAGSIGIIGIALIFSVSQGVNNFIDQVQQDTLSSYPITIEAESVDMTSMVTSLMGVQQEAEEGEAHKDDRVYSSTVMYELINSLVNAEVKTNDLRSFKEFLDAGGDGIADLATIRYGYDFNFEVYTRDEDGGIVKSDVMSLMQNAMTAMYGGDYSSYFNTMGSMYESMDVWQELLPGEDGEMVAEQVKAQYDLLYGTWPTAENEVILFVDENNEISDLMLYALGYISSDDMTESMNALMDGEALEAEQLSWSYAELCENRFKLLLPAEHYQLAADGGYTNLTETSAGLEYLYENEDIGVNLRVVGIARPNADATSTMVTGAIGYTAALTTSAIKATHETDIVSAQLADASVDVISGLPFRTGDEVEPTDEEKQAAVSDYLSGLSTEEKAACYLDAMSQPSEEMLSETVSAQMEGVTRADIEEQSVAQYAEQMGMDEETVRSYIAQMDDETLFATVEETLREQISEQYAAEVKASLSAQSYAELAAALDMTLEGSAYVQPFTAAQYTYLYDTYMPATVSESSYEENLDLLGYVDLAEPSSINLYVNTFADKDTVADSIERYNEGKTEEQQISYTDYVALLMSSVTTIINAITYVLIAFVAVSLIVSSIMIGVITLISVQERTKEIGILRAIGASKKNVSSMFNAETMIIGFLSGALGVVITYLLCIPINAILYHLTNIGNLKAVLPLPVGLALVVISVLLTLIAGIIPSRSAARKDPVVALRTE